MKTIGSGARLITMSRGRPD